MSSENHDNLAIDMTEEVYVKLQWKHISMLVAHFTNDIPLHPADAGVLLDRIKKADSLQGHLIDAGLMKNVIPIKKDKP